MPNSKNSLHNLNCISNTVALSHLVTYWILWHVFQLLKSMKTPQQCFFWKLCTWVSWIPIPQCHLLNTDTVQELLTNHPPHRTGDTQHRYSVLQNHLHYHHLSRAGESILLKYYKHIHSLKAFQQTTLTDTWRFGRLQEPILAVFSTNTFNICTRKSKQVFQNSSFLLRWELHRWEVAPRHHHTFNFCKRGFHLSQKQDSQYYPLDII